MSVITAAKRMAEPVHRLTSRIGAAIVAQLERTRPGRVLLAAGRFAWSRIPKWLRVVLAACLVIPGPADEALTAAVAIVVVGASLAFSPAARSELAASVKAAWEVRPQQ